MFEILDDVVRNADKANAPREGDYIGADGFLYCGKCHTPKQCLFNAFGMSRKVGCMCDCAAEKYKKEREFFQQSKKKEANEKRRNTGISDAFYRKFRFETDKGYCPEGIKAAKWYADNFRYLRSQNKGMMFMGSVGTGKTFSACCIANALVDKGYSVYVTTMPELLRVTDDFYLRGEAFGKISDADLLVLDDFGTTYSTKNNLERIFEIIDKRVLSEKPLIITTNLSPKDLKEPKNADLLRIYDRIKQACASEKSPVVLTGNSIREIIANQKHSRSLPANDFRSSQAV